jgi:hypothetical protein
LFRYYTVFMRPNYCAVREVCNTFCIIASYEFKLQYLEVKFALGVAELHYFDEASAPGKFFDPPPADPAPALTLLYRKPTFPKLPEVPILQYMI